MTAWYDYPITQGFSWTDHHRTWHSGIDIGAPFDTPVTAALSGVVTFAQCKPWGGQVDILTTWNGLPHVVTVLHLHRMVVSRGQSVAAGQLLGYSGGDGRGPCATQMPKYSNGPHVHFEFTLGAVGPYHGGPPYRVSASSTTVDPKPLLDALRSGLAQSGVGAFGAVAGANSDAALLPTATPVALPTLSAIFAVPQAAVDAINAIPGIDNLIYRLHEAETFPGWKSLDQVAPLGTGAGAANAGSAIGASAGGIIGNAIAPGAGAIGAGAGAAIGGGVGTLGANLNPGRLVYWIAGNLIGNARAAFVRLIYLGLGGMLLLALVIALGSAQADVTLHVAEDVTQMAEPVLAAATVA